MADETFKRPAPKQDRRRPQSIHVDADILTSSGSNSPRRPPPAERIPPSPSMRTSSQSVQTPASPSKSIHARSISLADSVRQSNRLSMSFPVCPPSAKPSRPPSWANTPTASPIDAFGSSEGSFLTQLASQERHVLELKESLRQAEAELQRLKKQWAMHEAQRKRGDVRRVTQLQPLSANVSSLETSEDDVDGSSQWLYKEIEKRKALLSGIKTSNRKVFSGSRHTRTLSLLSPEKGSFSQSFPQPAEFRRSEDSPYREPTLGETTATLTSLDDTLSPMDGTVSKEAILRTGKQMATDIREGLWTFFEDIRQATVGEEAVYGPDGGAEAASKAALIRSNTIGSSSRAHTSLANRTLSTNHSKRDVRHDTLIDIGGSFWREHGVGTPTQEKNTKSLRRTAWKSAAPLPHSTDLDDSWDNWGTPIKGTAITKAVSLSSAGSGDSEHMDDTSSDATGTPLTDEHSRPTPRTSVDRVLTPQSHTRSSAAGRRDSIPWPNLDKLTPSSLKRTASHLMREWEKNLTPSPAHSPSVETELETTLLDTPCSFGGKSNKSN